jgi:hypothetical protein
MSTQNFHSGIFHGCPSIVITVQVEHNTQIMVNNKLPSRQCHSELCQNNIGDNENQSNDVKEDTHGKMTCGRGQMPTMWLLHHVYQKVHKSLALK